MKIILGSSSENRKKVLEKAGYEFLVMKPDIDEKKIRTSDYYKLPLLIAREKSKALLSQIKDPAIVITADQVVVWNGELREKPSSKDEAKMFLESYSKNIQVPIECVNGLVVVNTKTGKTAEGTDTSKVFLKPFPKNAIDTLVERGDVLNWAGGITTENNLVRGLINIDRIEGTSDSVLGLPLIFLKELISKVQD